MKRKAAHTHQPRAIDVYVDSLNLQELGFQHSQGGLTSYSNAVVTSAIINRVKSDTLIIIP